MIKENREIDYSQTAHKKKIVFVIGIFLVIAFFFLLSFRRNRILPTPLTDQAQKSQTNQAKKDMADFLSQQLLDFYIPKQLNVFPEKQINPLSGSENTFIASWPLGNNNINVSIHYANSNTISDKKISITLASLPTNNLTTFDSQALIARYLRKKSQAPWTCSQITLKDAHKNQATICQSDFIDNQNIKHEVGVLSPTEDTQKGEIFVCELTKESAKYNQPSCRI